MHPRSLISAFVIRCLDSMISLVSILAISRLSLASLAEQTGLSHTWSKTPKTGFLVTRLRKKFNAERWYRRSHLNCQNECLKMIVFLLTDICDSTSTHFLLCSLISHHYVALSCNSDPISWRSRR